MNSIITGIQDDYNTIEVYLKDTTTSDRTIEIQEEIKTWDNVDTVTYRSKEDAMTILKDRWGENAYLLDSLGENPLPNSIVVTMDDLDLAGGVAEDAKKIEGIESVAFYKDTVDKLLTVTNSLQIGAVILMLFLVIVSVVVVSNTIKLTVVARSEEIIIMRYVGATNGFIRGPFLIEGIAIGLISAVISATCVLGLYSFILNTFGTEILAMLSTSLVPVRDLAVYVAAIFFGLGLFIGTWGSMLSMRRFLEK